MMRNFCFFNGLVAKTAFVFVVVIVVLQARGADTQVVQPFEIEGQYNPFNKIDTLVMKTLREKGIAPAFLCSDAVFMRRVYLDVNGTLPD